MANLTLYKILIRLTGGICMFLLESAPKEAADLIIEAYTNYTYISLVPSSICKSCEAVFNLNFSSGISAK